MASDLNPFQHFIDKLSNDLIATAGLAQDIIRRYDKPGKENYMNTFSNLRNEFRLLTDTHDSIKNIFKDYKTLHKNKRSVLPIVGKAMNFLFGVVTEESISTIKSNIRNIARFSRKPLHIKRN